MAKSKLNFEYDVYNSIRELHASDAAILRKARSVTRQAYAPYSNFFVGAAALLANGKTATGTNQENASYPVGICAERVLLSTISSLYPGAAIRTIAVSYAGYKVKADHPVSPCGMCRQALLEYETRSKKPIRIILSGQTGKVFIIRSVSQLLPFAFTNVELK
jgi:cytidine deaminase